MGLIIKNNVVYNGAESEPIIYSEEEREVGVWTDGKPLYQKTINFGTLPTGVEKTITHNISNIDHVVSCTAIAKNPNGITLQIPYVNSGTDRVGVFVTNTSVGISSSTNLSAYSETYITIQYTKTTDTPGSGIWTPSGVKTVHYSENEQVIGTWIDGSTLYEKTLYQDLSGQAEHWYVYLDTLIDNINDYTIVNFQGQLQFKEGSYIYAHVVPNPHGSYYINRNSGRWYLYFHSGNATCTWGYMTATIRYVKKLLGQPSS